MISKRTRRPVSARLLLSALCLFLAIGWISPVGAKTSGSPVVEFVAVEGVIDPVVARFIDRQISAAEDEGSAAVILQIDTPGGLDVSMRQIVRKVLNADVPVIVWVAPAGARAASAGVFIAYSAHISAMAPGTNIGAAHPVDLGGSQDETMSQKATNDAAAYLASIAQKRGRDVDFARSAVFESESIDAEEALSRHVIDVIASNAAELSQKIEGQKVQVRSGSVSIPDAFLLRFHKMGVLDRMLHSAIQPEIAYMLLLIGFYGLIFELYNPGIGAAGIVGGVCLVFGFYALSILPTSWAGVALLVLAVVFFLLDLHVAGLGVFTVGGALALVAGSLLLFSNASPQLRLPWWSIATAALVTVIFFLSVMTAAVRARTAKPISGSEGIVGTFGRARTDISPEGQVMAKGTLWRARTLGAAIAQGAEVEIKGVKGLMLMVEPSGREEPLASQPAKQEGEEI